MRSDNPFTPGFGAPPEMFFGRRSYLDLLEHAMDDPHDRYRIFFLEGTRGSGKTVLLHRLAEVAGRSGWYACEMNSLHAARELGQDLEEANRRTKGLRASLNPKITIPGVGSASLGKLENEKTIAQPESTLSRSLVSFLERKSRWKGVLIVIDEAQKLAEQDAQEICVAVQSARMRGLPIMLVLAGLPGTKALISGYPGCTFMRRAPRFVLETLLKDETLEALGTSFELVPEIELSCETLEDLAHFTQGHPYLIQLIGDSLYRLVEELYGELIDREGAVVEPSTGDVAFAKERAYEAYREDVLDPVLSALRNGSLAYLKAIVETMGGDGVMTSGSEIAAAMGKGSARDISYTRQRLIDLCILEDLGRGKLGFVIPYIPRYLSEEDYQRTFAVSREGRWLKEV